MIKQRWWAVCGAAAAALLVSAIVRDTLSAQNPGNSHGIPQPEKVYGNGVTWPIKVEVRAYDMEKLTTPPALAEDALVGRTLWVQKCAYCHDGVGQPTYRTMGPWLGAETINTLGEGNVRSFISAGDVRMPGFQYDLDARQMDDVIAFLKTVPATQKPTAGQYAARTEGAASD